MAQNPSTNIPVIEIIRALECAPPGKIVPGAASSFGAGGTSISLMRQGGWGWVAWRHVPGKRGLQDHTLYGWISAWRISWAVERWELRG